MSKSTRKNPGRKPSERRPRGNMVTFYYGTSSTHEETILTHGLQSQRQSGCLYVASPYKARAYASAWAVGCHALGLADRPEGVVFAIDIPGDTEATVNQAGELRLQLDRVPPERVRVHERGDLTGITAAERAGHLFHLLGVVAWDRDPYPDGSSYPGLIEKLKAVIKGIPDELIQEGLSMMPSL